jgi:hypothetical protein
VNPTAVAAAAATTAAVAATTTCVHRYRAADEHPRGRRKPQPIGEAGQHPERPHAALDQRSTVSEHGVGYWPGEPLALHEAEDRRCNVRNVTEHGRGAGP